MNKLSKDDIEFITKFIDDINITNPTITLEEIQDKLELFGFNEIDVKIIYNNWLDEKIFYFISDKVYDEDERLGKINFEHDGFPDIDLDFKDVYITFGEGVVIRNRRLLTPKKQI